MEFVIQRWLLVSVLVSVVVASGCASTPQRPLVAGDDPTQKAERINPDPWEGFNRKVFVFNDTLDGWILKPIAKGYQFIAPDPVEVGVSNFFTNLGEVPSALNNVLQWKWKKVGNNTGRFLLNSTVGLAGLFDVAKYTGLKRKDSESFGQTLSHWGVGAGPYLVLPLMGPSTLTDTLSTPVDWYSQPLSYYENEEVRYALVGLNLIDQRAGLLEAEELISGDRYTFIRQAFLQRREYLVKDGVVVDDFGGEFEEFDEDF